MVSQRHFSYIHRRICQDNIIAQGGYELINESGVIPTQLFRELIARKIEKTRVRFISNAFALTGSNTIRNRGEIKINLPLILAFNAHI